jgi:phospholipid/cholesterol/gamma-HCH transport system substrate-binding protein
VEAEAKYTLVGAFVICALAFIVFALIWLSKIGSSADLTSYTIYFGNTSLTGLQVNSAVTMRGIRVGSVKTLEIAPKNIELVKVIVKLEKDTPVKVNTTAVINRNLLTGLASIDLQGGTEDSQPLVVIPPGERFPVIPEGTSGIDKVASSIPELIQEMTGMVGRVSKLLEDENIKRFENIMANIETLSGTIAGKSGEIERLVENTGSLVQKMDQISQNIARITRPGDGDLARLSANLADGAEQVSGMVRNLDEKTSALSTELTNSVRVITQDVNTAATGIAQAAKSFSTTAEHLSDIRSIIRGPDESKLGPGEMQ